LTIPNILLFVYLGKKMNYGRHPISYASSGLSSASFTTAETGNIMGACHNSFFCPNTQVPSSKCLIWNGLGTGLGLCCLRKICNYFLLKSVPNPFSGKKIFRFWQNMIQVYDPGAEDYHCMGDQCMPWLRYGGKLMDLGI
jgi:hypothetical protein